VTSKDMIKKKTNTDKILVMSNWNLYMGDFLESFVWSSMDHSKDNFKNNHLIFKFKYFIFLKKWLLPFPMNFLNNYHLHFLINISIL
jgi:hypothetical protein